MAWLVLVLLALALAYSNGSNDVSKGIATLVGSGVSNFRAAALWGSFWTVAGGLAAAFASQGLVATFSGKGFLDAPISGPAFLASVAIGAAAWVLFATRTGLPVSTTHAIAGSLAGAALVARGASALHWGFLAQKVAVPLAISPFLAILLTLALVPRLARATARVERYCLCVERRSAISTGAVWTAAAGAADYAVVGEVKDCDASPTIAARISAVDALHWTSAALTSFARALNDTPKIVALGLAASALVGLRGPAFFFMVTAAMGIGSLIGGLRVTETLARKVTRMSATEGFTANLVTTLLVGAASVAALPVSTTHVSSGAIVGMGLARGSGSVRWPTVREMALAWLVTLPVAAFVGGLAFLLLRRI